MSSTLEIRDTGYRVWYEPEAHTIYFEGSLRLNPGGYTPISNLLKHVLMQSPGRIRLHLHDLQYLNSSGLNMLFKFVIAIRNKGSVQLVVHASKEVFWHSRTLANIERFFPAAEIELS